jgi:hypothetical protein
MKLKKTDMVYNADIIEQKMPIYNILFNNGTTHTGSELVPTLRFYKKSPQYKETAISGYAMALILHLKLE